MICKTLHSVFMFFVHKTVFVSLALYYTCADLPTRWQLKMKYKEFIISKLQGRFSLEHEKRRVNH